MGKYKEMLEMRYLWAEMRVHYYEIVFVKVFLVPLKEDYPETSE